MFYNSGGVRYLALVAMLSAVVALACSPAVRPPAEDNGGSEGTRKGKRVEVAGLKIEVPEGNEFWAPTVPPDSREPRYGGTLTFANPADPPAIDPARTTSYLRSRIVTSTYERLIEWATEPGADPIKVKLVPGLAESWEISKDGLSYSFKLRQGVKWANVPPVNGRAFTSEDVGFSYDYYNRKDSVVSSGFDNVARLEIPDKYTVVYHLKERQAGFIYEIAGEGVGLIVPSEVVEQEGDLRKLLIGTGPFYSVDGYQPKVGIDLKRNPDYWARDQAGRQLPYLDGWKIRVIADQSARQAAMRAGKLDWGSEFSTPSQLRPFLKTNPNVYGQEYVAPGGGQGYMFSLDKAPWNDVKVRRSLSLAVNYNEMAQVVLEVPRATLSTEVRGWWVGEEDTTEDLPEWYRYDPERAKKLLADAGFPNGLSTTLEFFEYSKADVARAEMLKDYWSKIGVDVELKNMEYTVFRANVDAAGWQNISYSFAFPQRQDIDSILQFPYSKGLGNKTQGGINDPQVDRWVESFWASTDETERTGLLKKIRHHLNEQVFYIPIPSGPSFQIIQPWVRNFQPINNAFSAAKGHRVLMHAWIDDSWRK